MKTERIKVAVVTGWTAALFTGCSMIPSVGPNYEEPVLTVPEYTLPDAGQPTSNLTATCEYRPASAEDDRRITVSKNVIEKWWERFDDPVLVGLVEGGISNNVGYLMAQKRLEQRNYELLGSYAAYLPHFDGQGAWQRNWFGKKATGHTTERNFSAYNAQNVGLDGNWEIDIFGGSRRATEAAFAQAEAAGWTVADAWLSLTAQIGTSYIQLRTTQALIDVARTNLVLQSETYDILKSRLDSGIGDELAVNQCAYIVEETRAKIPTLIAQEEQYKNRLEILAGEMPGALHELLKPVTNRDWLLAPQKVAELKLAMMRARPDVKAAERELAAETARLGVAEAQWFPKFYISGLVGWKTTGRARIFRADSFIADLGPSFSWPIFEGGAIYANVKATEAKMQELALAYEESIEKAYGEVRDNYSAYSQEYHRYRALSGAVKAATDAVTISQDLYKNGLRDFNNVLDAQRSRLAYEEQYARSRGQITINLIELYKSLGGGLAYDDHGRSPSGWRLTISGR